MVVLSECTPLCPASWRSAAKVICNGRLCTGWADAHPRLGACHGTCSYSEFCSFSITWVSYGCLTAYAHTTASPLRTGADTAPGDPASRGLDASPSPAPSHPGACFLGNKHVQWSENVADVAVYPRCGSDADGRLASPWRDSPGMVAEGVASNARARKCRACADHTLSVVDSKPRDAIDASCRLGRHEASQHGAMGDRAARYGPALNALRPGRDVP